MDFVTLRRASLTSDGASEPGALLNESSHTLACGLIRGAPGMARVYFGEVYSGGVWAELVATWL